MSLCGLMISDKLYLIRTIHSITIPEEFTNISDFPLPEQEMISVCVCSYSVCLQYLLQFLIYINLLQKSASKDPRGIMDSKPNANVVGSQ